nr:hypothetical protein Iba_chr10cCG3280 [Ipomoea batatas]GMD50132.1 hypothetical protein Iba_scaffold46859CG0010 [Ipomoea batatas]
MTWQLFTKCLYACGLSKRRTTPHTADTGAAMESASAVDTAAAIAYTWRPPPGLVFEAKQTSPADSEAFQTLQINQSQD